MSAAVYGTAPRAAALALAIGGAFALLGVEPLFGRAILPEDDIARGGHPVVMLGHGYWQRAFGADPQVVGRTLRMGGRDYTIIGVAPPTYRGGLSLLTPAFYVPMSMLDEVLQEMSVMKPQPGLNMQQTAQWIAEHQQITRNILGQMMEEHHLMMQQMDDR